MNTSDYLALAIQYGGYTSTDVAMLTNLLERTEGDLARLSLLVPPPSVVNAYFAEYFQKHGADAAFDYFYELSVAFKNFYGAPTFGREGAEGYETFRFIRLNVNNKSYGLAYVHEGARDAVIFPERDYDMTEEDMALLVSLFPGHELTVDGKTYKLQA
jgi:hypothetical protein